MIYQIETTDDKVYIVESQKNIGKIVNTLVCEDWHIYYQLNNQIIALRESDIKRIIVLKD
jgi:hypothetical protein